MGHNYDRRGHIARTAVVRVDLPPGLHWATAKQPLSAHEKRVLAKAMQKLLADDPKVVTLDAIQDLISSPLIPKAWRQGEEGSAIVAHLMGAVLKANGYTEDGEDFVKAPTS